MAILSIFSAFVVLSIQSRGMPSMPYMAPHIAPPKSAREQLHPPALMHFLIASGYDCDVTTACIAP